MADNVFVIAGDPPEPAGPYEGARDLITTAPLDEYGVHTISISGYPEGHPDISAEVLWGAIETKANVLTELGKAGDIITQFGFDVDPVIEWIEQVRALGISMPIRVGVPGPAGIKRLLGFARRFGVGSSATIVKKYGISMTNLLGTAGPDRFIHDLAERLDPERHGTVGLHFYTFGGMSKTAEWIREFAAFNPAIAGLPTEATAHVG